jgi:hypothetical protein
MNIFENKKVLIFVLSAVLLIGIALLFFPGFLKPVVKPVANRIQTSAEINQINNQSKDTSLDSIKKDLNNTKLDDADKELNLIDKEINAAI